MPESLDITYYIAKQYPSLRPENHKDQIVELLNELYNINFLALTFCSTPIVSTDKKVAVEEKLAQPGLSEKYRHALARRKWCKIYPFFQKTNSSWINVYFSIQSEKNSRASLEELHGEANNAKTFLEKIGKL